MQRHQPPDHGGDRALERSRSRAPGGRSGAAPARRCDRGEREHQRDADRQQLVGTNRCSTARATSISSSASSGHATRRAHETANTPLPRAPPADARSPTPPRRTRRGRSPPRPPPTTRAPSRAPRPAGSPAGRALQVEFETIHPRSITDGRATIADPHEETEHMAEDRDPSREMHRWMTQLWLRAGSDERESRLVADHLVGANLAGHDSHGIGMAPRYVKSWKVGELQLNREVAIDVDNGALITVDARHGMGQSVTWQAMELAIARAREHGVCVMGLRNSHHLGRVGHWAEQAISAGMASVHFTNAVAAVPMVAPPRRRRRALLLTNPFTVGIPRPGGEPFVLDLRHQRDRPRQGPRRLEQEEVRSDRAGARGLPDRRDGPPARATRRDVRAARGPARRAADGGRPQGLRARDGLRAAGRRAHRRRDRRARAPHDAVRDLEQHARDRLRPDPHRPRRALRVRGAASSATGCSRPRCRARPTGS